MNIYWTEIEEIIKEHDHIYSFILTPPENFTWQEGAHTHFALENFWDGPDPDKGLVRHMSISTSPSEGNIGITTKIDLEHRSRFKNDLSQKLIGSPVALFKTGSRLHLRRMDKPIVLLSQGISRSAFRPLILNYLADQSMIPQLYSLSVGRLEEEIFHDLFVSDPAIDFYSKVTYSREEYYGELAQLVNHTDAYYYVVGSDQFIGQNAKTLIGHGVDPDRLIIDRSDKKLLEILNV